MHVFEKYFISICVLMTKTVLKNWHESKLSGILYVNGKTIQNIITGMWKWNFFLFKKNN